MVSVGGIVSVGGGGGTSSSTSGITTINPGGNTGPIVDFQGVNGIEVSSPSNNIIVVDGAGASGTSTRFSATFTSITSGLFVHNLNTLDVLVQVRDKQGGGGRVMLPDAIIIENADQVSLLFNTPQTGRIIVF